MIGSTNSSLAYDTVPRRNAPCGQKYWKNRFSRRRLLLCLVYVTRERIKKKNHFDLALIIGIKVYGPERKKHVMDEKHFRYGHSSERIVSVTIIAITGIVSIVKTGQIEKNKNKNWIYYSRVGRCYRWVFLGRYKTGYTGDFSFYIILLDHKSIGANKTIFLCMTV